MAEGQADTAHAPPKALAKLHRMILQIIQAEKGKDATSRDVTGRVTKTKGKSTKGKGKTTTKGW
jgi:hypothetical protein